MKAVCLASIGIGLTLGVILLVGCGGDVKQPIPEPTEEPYYYGGILRLEHAQFLPPDSGILFNGDPDAYYRRLNTKFESKGLWVQTRYEGGLALRPRYEDAYVSVIFVYCGRCLTAGIK